MVSYPFTRAHGRAYSQTSSNSRGHSACETTPAGQFSTNASNTTYPCPLGKYQREDGSPACYDCSRGVYTDEQSQTECKACGVGMSSLVGQSKCFLCPNGLALRSRTSERGARARPRLLRPPRRACNCSGGATSRSSARVDRAHNNHKELPPVRARTYEPNSHTDRAFTHNTQATSKT